MKRLNRILSLALAAMMALTLLTGCGGKVTERAMEKAYGDYPDILETDERIEMPAKAEIRKTFMIN